MRRIGAFIAAATFWAASAAGAATVAIDYDFVNQGTLEDFESYPPGPAGVGGPIGPILPASFVEAPERGLALFPSFFVRIDGPYLPTIWDEAPCGGAGGQCLSARPDPAAALPIGFVPPPRMTLGGFAPGTRSVGLRIIGSFPFLGVRVEGGSGGFEQTIFPSEGLLEPRDLAWDDPRGIKSVVLTGPMDIDDVRTSHLAPVPLPPAWGLLAVGLAMLGWMRRHPRDQ